MSHVAKPEPEEELYGSKVAVEPTEEMSQKKAQTMQKRNVPKAPKQQQWPASFSAKDFPWERLTVGEAKRNPNQKTSFFTSARIEGAPWGYKLRCHLLGVKSPFGFSPPMEGGNAKKWSYAVSLEDPEIHAAFRRGDTLMKPQLMRSFGDQKQRLTEYVEMAKDPRAAQNGSVYPAALKMQVPLTDDEPPVPSEAKFIKDGAVVDSSVWENYQKKPHTADVLMELRSCWYASGKYGLKWVLIRLRSNDDVVCGDAKFPDEIAADEAAELDAAQGEQTENANGDASEQANEASSDETNTAEKAEVAPAQDSKPDRKRKRDGEDQSAASKHAKKDT